MGLEGQRLPEKNLLPLNVQRSDLLARSGESDVWCADVKDSREQEAQVVLKENREHAFASDEEMQRSKKYYEYLKNFPGFGNFIPDTLYFKARKAADEPVRSYCIQRLLPGKTINRLSDAELQKDPAVAKQVLEFIDATIAILRATRKERRIKPDFGKSPDDDSYGTYMANTMLNPRYSNNILITDLPDKDGRRVFFVDTGENVGERKRIFWRFFQRHFVGRKQEKRLKMWKKELLQSRQ